jgi:hypothetical protein
VVSGPVDLGQTFRYRHTVLVGSSPADAGSSNIIRITRPDGTVDTQTIVHSGVGLYDIAYLTVAAGWHVISGDFTGGVLGAEHDVWEDGFTVEEPARFFVGVDEAVAHLRAAGVIVGADDREQLRWLCLAACEAVERDLGRAISRRVVTGERHDGGDNAVFLRWTPVIAVTQVVESGTTLTGGSDVDWVLDGSTGLLYRGSTTWQGCWAAGRRNITAAYVAGYTIPPRPARKVALSAVEQAWQTSQQLPRGSFDADTIDAAVFAGAAQLTPWERSAYEGLRAAGIA